MHRARIDNQYSVVQRFQEGLCAPGHFPAPALFEIDDELVLRQVDVARDRQVGAHELCPYNLRFVGSGLAEVLAHLVHCKLDVLAVEFILFLH